MSSNSIEDLLKAVAAAGVREVCLCAGARNAPFVFALEQARGVKTHHFFDERSAVFFALGRATASLRPVAVVTTSGTAVAELLPAVIESFYQGVPLILITADRPKEFRGSGAPQTIEQAGIFSSYVEEEHDIDLTDDRLNLEEWQKRAPIHINVCLPDPQNEKDGKAWDWPISKELVPSQKSVDDSGRISQFFQRVQRPLIILSSLTRADMEMESHIIEAPWPMYIEGTSGLRESQRLSSKQLQAGEDMVYRLLKTKEVDGVIRIGGVPTLRAWRNLDEDLQSVPVLNFSSQKWSGLAREKKSALPLSSLSYLKEFYLGGDFTEEILTQDRQFSEKLRGLFEKFPRSEVACFSRLSHLVGGEVFVGNSLPIREWDLAAQFDRSVHVIANRGANGIDGQVSTFLGSSPKWGVFGDLTTLYDLSSLWALKFSSQPKMIVVINNGGGQIFQRKFSSPGFLNSHELGFRKWAEMWNIKYQAWQEVPASIKSDSHQVIELMPCAEQSEGFWRAYKEFWQ